MTLDDKCTARQKFEKDISDLLHSNNPHGRSLIRFIQTQLRKRNIRHSDWEDVLSKAVQQGLEDTIKTGEEIRKPAAWLRTAIIGISNNHVRRNIRQEKFVEQSGKTNYQLCNAPMDQLEWKDQMSLLDQALQTLSEDDREILILYFYQDKSYEEIQNHIGHKHIELATIRKRVSRARKRLIATFQQLSTPATLSK
jgi:RNA polymerase sigma factor (sigma-70 family)